MPIEFRCSQCDKLLRTGDDTAGKRAKCPQCGNILTVPSPATPPPAAGQPGTGQPAPGGDSPFGPGGQEQSPGGDSPFGHATQQPAFGADPENPYRSPAEESGFATPPGMAGTITPTQIDLGEVFNRTWAIFKVQWGASLIAVIVVGLINFAFNFAVGFGTGVLGAMVGDDVIMFLLAIIREFVTYAFSTWIGIGLAIYMLRIVRGQSPELGEIFTGGRVFLPVLLAGILLTLICIAGLFLLIVPAIIFGLMFSQYYYLIIDRNVGVIDSFSISKDLTDGNKLTLFLISLVGGLVAVVVVVLTCGIGALAVIPFFALLQPTIYLMITGQPTADQIWSQQQPMR